MSVSVPKDSTAKVGCDCIELTNKALAEHNTELGLNFQINQRTGGITTYIALHTTLIEKKRGAKPISILPTFCPFCGTRYAATPPAPTTAAEVQRNG